MRFAVSTLDVCAIEVRLWRGLSSACDFVEEAAEKRKIEMGGKVVLVIAHRRDDRGSKFFVPSLRTPRRNRNK